MPHASARIAPRTSSAGSGRRAGFRLEVPALSLSEPFMKPSTMLYRNLLAMETEELLRSYPFDGAVLLGGCDKTTPALVMGAVSAGLPFIFVPAGPMLRARWRGATLGSGSRRLEVLGRAARREHHARPTGTRSRSGSPARPGHCMTMGTASTMTSAVEALGLVAAGRRLDPRRRSAITRGWRSPRAAGSSSLPASPLSPGVLRERDQGRAGAGRLHQRGHPPDRDGRPSRNRAVTSTASTSSPARFRCWPTSGRPAST